MGISWTDVWQLSMVAVCVVAGALWPGSRLKKLVAFLVLSVATVGFARLPIWGFPTFWFAFAIPLLAILWGARQRPWRWWRIAAGVPALLLLAGLAFAGVAIWASNAMIPTEAVAHLGDFLAAKQAVRSNLNDPDSAVFKDLRLNMYHGDRYVCGEVNARNRMGGLVGFTRFFVRADQVMPFPTFNPSDDTEGFATYMRTCFGDDWEKPLTAPTS